MIQKRPQRSWEWFCKRLGRKSFGQEKRQINHGLTDGSGLSCGHGDGGERVDQNGERDER